MNNPVDAASELGMTTDCPMWRLISNVARLGRLALRSLRLHPDYSRRASSQGIPKAAAATVYSKLFSRACVAKALPRLFLNFVWLESDVGHTKYWRCLG